MGKDEKLRPMFRELDAARRIIDRAPEWDYWDLGFSRFADQPASDPTVQDFAQFLP
jgi:hypothetical protein